MLQQLHDYYRLPEGWGAISSTPTLTGDPGFFQFGGDATLYGRCETGLAPHVNGASLHDASKDVRIDGREIRFPFDPFELVENLLRERYTRAPSTGHAGVLGHPTVHQSYYALRKFLPTSIRSYFQRLYLRNWRQIPFPKWPVDSSVDTFHEHMLALSIKANGVERIPFIWFWPEGAPACLIMTHDVEGPAGRDFSTKLMDMDDEYGIRASFQVVPEVRYEVPADYVHEISTRGFEFNVHDLNHDGFLFRERHEFLRRAAKINSYLEQYGATGFRSAAMYRNQDWFDALHCSYDMSVPAVAHLEPQRGGCCAIRPFFIGNIVELPLTAAQDYSLFHILNDYSLDLWKEQLTLLRQKNGLMSFIVHPDYLLSGRARDTYQQLLGYLRTLIARDKIWMTLPGEVDRWWRARSKMTLVPQGTGWAIEGPGHDRARVAYAVLDKDRVVYELA